MNMFTVMGVVYDHPHSPCRCFGWKPSLQEAEEVVLANKGGMDEGAYYQWVVIEEMSEGFWANSMGKETWYQWDDDETYESPHYVKVNKPERFKSMVSWGMG